MNAPLLMTDPPTTTEPFSFHLPRELEAREPAEIRSGSRDAVRMLVSVGDEDPRDQAFTDLPVVLKPGDLLVVNNSGTLPAAFDATAPSGDRVAVHLSTMQPAGLWVVEVRTPAAGGSSTPHAAVAAGEVLTTQGGGAVHLLSRYPGSQRLWLAHVDLPMPVDMWLARHGRAIRYGYVERDWPIGSYQSVFSAEPGSAEMPSAGRPFTSDLVTGLVVHGIGITPLTLHTGVSSLEAHETPYPEPFSVPRVTADRVNDAHRHGGRVIAVGTTVVRALESATDDRGIVHPTNGWTDVVITPERGVRAVDGLLTGWHEPEASHLLMLEAVAGRFALRKAYDHALAQRYLWHEFGDVHLIVRPFLRPVRQ